MDEAREWLSQSEYDLETAQAMLDSRRYIYAVFMCHMAVTHSLVQLVGLASPNLTPDEIKFLTRLSSAGVSTRYPEELSKALDDFPPTVVQEYVRRAGEVVECLRKQVS